MNERQRGVRLVRRVHLRYDGTDTALIVGFGPIADMVQQFEAAYRTRYSFLMPNRALVAEAVSVPLAAQVACTPVVAALSGQVSLVAVGANLLAARSSGVSGAFNVGSGVSISVNQLVAMMLDASETPAPVQHVEPRKGEVRDSRADISAAREVLGYEPTVHIEQGLAEYMAWAKSELA